jgi:hypothetical protein
MLITVKDVAALVATHTGITVEQIYGKRRDKPIARARFAVCCIARRNGLSFPQIGARIGRDHSSVMHAVKMAEEWERRDPAFAQLLADVVEGKGKEPERPIYLPAYASAPAKKRKPRKPMFDKDADPLDAGVIFHKGVAKGSDNLLAALMAA